MRQIVIDACIMHYYFPEAEDEEGAFFNLIQYIMMKYKIAVDDGGKIEQEWRQQGNYIFIAEWLTEQIKNGKIVLLSSSLDRAKTNKIFNKYGLNRRERDIEYIKTANVANMKYILTEDIDFYDPQKKEANNKSKEKLKNKRTGPLLIFLRKTLKIKVASLRHLREDLIVPQRLTIPDYPNR